MTATAVRATWFADWVWDNPVFKLHLRRRFLPRKHLAGLALVLFMWGGGSLAVIFDRLAAPVITLTYAAYSAIFALGAAGEAAWLFAQDREHRTEDDLRLTMLSPAQLLCGRTAAIFVQYALPALLMLPLYLAITVLIPTFNGEFASAFAVNITPVGLTALAIPVFALLFMFAIAIGCASGAALPTAISASAVACAGFIVFGGGIPAAVLLLLAALFHSTPAMMPSCTASVIMLCHAFFTVLLFRTAHHTLHNRGSRHGHR